MKKRFYKSFCFHTCWFTEWWTTFLLLSMGIFAVLKPGSKMIHQFFLGAYLTNIPDQLWQSLFTLIGFVQFGVLLLESFIGRVIASFLASVLFIWGTLTIVVYGLQWHFNLIAWGIFALINLYVLARNLSGVEQAYEYNL